MAQWKNTGGLKQKHKKQPFSDACASHLSLANQRDGSFGMPLAYTNQKLLCLQWKCGLGLEMALSVEARRGSAPCRWAFPGVLFIIKKMLERNFW